MDAELVLWGERVRGCEDVQLMAELQTLVRRDRRCESRMLMVLAEVDARRLFLEQGYSSLFRYATEVLRMSEPQAYLRIQAARLARRYAVVLEMLAEGALNLSTLKLLDPHLTPDNHAALLERARNKTKREVELLVAEVAPQPDVPNQIRKLPGPVESKSARRDGPPVPELPRPAVEAEAKDVAVATVSLHVQEAAGVQREAAPAAAVAAPAEVNHVPMTFALEAPRASCTPLRPGRFKWEMTASQRLQEKLMQLQHLLRHQVPGGDLAVIVELAFDGLLDKKLKQRFAQVSQPRAAAVKSSAAVAAARGSEGNDGQSARASNGVGLEVAVAERVEPGARTSGAEADHPSQTHRSTRSRYIPRAVLREVFARDSGQCTFISPDGHRCSERGMLEVHHVHAFALGGEATVDNLRLVCRSHNGFFADQDFGVAHMRSKRAAAADLQRSMRPV